MLQNRIDRHYYTSMRKVQARRIMSKEMDMDADEKRNYKLSCELHPFEIDLKKQNEESLSIRPSFCFFRESHSLFPSYAGLSFEMHHGGIASASSSGVPDARLYGLYLST